MSIIVSGSLAYDRIMNFPGLFKDNILPEKIHILNVSFTVSDLRQNFGGTAGNIAYNLALMGERPIVASAAGNDFSPYKKWLQKSGVITNFIKIAKNLPTACANIITDMSDNQITGFYGGAMFVKAGKIPTKILKKTTIAIVAPGNINDMADYSSQFRQARIPYIFDPGQAIPALSGRILRQCASGAKIFISNDYELSLVLKKTGWTKKQLLDKIEILVTTFGDQGSVFETRGKKIYIPIAKPKKILDPTGAGDAYRSGLIKGLIKKYPLAKIGRLAALVAVYTVEAYGTQTHKFSWKSLSERYRDNFKEKL